MEEKLYGELKSREKNSKAIKQCLRKTFENSDEKRHEFVKENLVVKFVAKNEYETNDQELLDFLYNLGLLHLGTKINPKVMGGN
ncbi:hypothetical protein ACFOU2_19170 [Bacillus songklensis]|uniref:Uncharacterized protein n=1 Tax=Bacillus songklensis TaxID=1069116 RepID=A0ABV8B5A6_9BACI